MTFLRPLTRGVAVAALLAVAACAPPRASSCPETPAATAAPLETEAPAVSSRNLRTLTAALAAPELDGRRAGSEGADRAAALVAARMRAAGLAAPWPGGYCQRFPVDAAAGYNVVGHLVDPDGDRPLVLVAAHYDGQGRHPTAGPLPGADDNASGVAALLEAARVAARGPRDAGWVFAATGGEEIGQLGARAYLAAPSVAPERVALAVNLDMVGRPWPGDEPRAIGYRVLSGDRDRLAAALRRAAGAAGVAIRPLDGLGDDALPGVTDAEVFAPRMPAVLLSTGLHADHHGLGDTPERLELDQVARAARLVLALPAALGVG